MTTLPFQLITFDGVALEGQAASLSVPTSDGEITVLPHHVPLVTLIEAGEAKLTLVKDGKPRQHFFAVGAGFLEVSHAGTALLTRTAEPLEAIDEQRVRAAIANAEQRLKELADQKAAGDEREVAETSALLARNLARLGVVRRRRHRS